MGSDHAHVSVRAGARYQRPLAIAFVLVVAFMVVEVVAGFLTGSLALLSDAGHMATDALGLGMALAAVAAANRSGPGGQRTYGLYRLEILAALANAVLLFAVGAYVLIEAVRRLQDPPAVVSGAMLAVAVLGLAVNVFAWALLRGGAAESLNVQGAFLEVIADLIGSLGVIVAAVVMLLTGWEYADPLIAAAIAVFILPRAWRLGRGALNVLVESAPEGVDVADLRMELASIPGVNDVHDLHVWTLTSDMDVATVHLVTAEATDSHPVLDRARAVLDGYGVSHATVQVEPDTHDGCDELSW